MDPTQTLGLQVSVCRGGGYPKGAAAIAEPKETEVFSLTWEVTQGLGGP